AASLLRRAADEYATSWHAAPPGAWGRPIAMLRCRLIAGDPAGAEHDAEAALAAGAVEAAGPIGGYCAALALLAVGRDAEAGAVAWRIAEEGLEPAAVAHALAALASSDEPAFELARRDVLGSFEERDAFLEDVAVADTVLVLDALARRRGLEVRPLGSALLPGQGRVWRRRGFRRRSRPLQGSARRRRDHPRKTSALLGRQLFGPRHRSL